jgi:hypothetical protein
MNSSAYSSSQPRAGKAPHLVVFEMWEDAVDQQMNMQRLRFLEDRGVWPSLSRYVLSQLRMHQPLWLSKAGVSRAHVRITLLLFQVSTF